METKIATHPRVVAAVQLMMMMMLAITGGAPEVVDHGVQLLFTSNRKEMQDIPIHFSPPLPSWLKGTLIRNGVGLFENGQRSVLHSFDGFAKLSSWKFHGKGRTTFSTRFLGTSFYNDSMASDTISPYMMFSGTDSPFSLFERVSALMSGLDNTNVNVVRFPAAEGKHKYDYVALNDYWKAYKFYPHDLSTGPSVLSNLRDVDGSLQRANFLDLLSSAHPLPETGTGNYLTFLISGSIFFFKSSVMKLVRIRSTLERDVIATWNVPNLPYMHSFSVTKTHALLLVFPLYIDVMCIIKNGTPFDCLQWNEQEPSTLYVVELKSGLVEQLSMENVFTMHHINAYNTEDGSIIMDISAYKNPDFIGDLRLSLLRNVSSQNSIHREADVGLRRYEVNLLTKTVKRVSQSLPQPGYINHLDMHTINEHYRSRQYCYVYGLVPKADNATLSHSAIVKRDVCGNGRDRSWLVPNHIPVEPIFVPKPNGKAEDDGVILAPMLDGLKARSYMVVLDALQMKPLSTADLPTHLPFSLHGSFFPEIL